MFQKKRRVEFLAFGDELLLGIRQNSHLTWLGDILGQHGLSLSRSQEIPDEEDEMVEVAGKAWERADILITTGGLGPTEDDRTVDALARAIGVSFYHDAQVEADIEAFFARRGYRPTLNNYRQCRILNGAAVLRNTVGTAPGQWFEAEGKILIVLPGPTQELRTMVREQVLPRMIDNGVAAEGDSFLQIRTMGIGESRVAEELTPIFERYGPSLRAAYCAHDGLVDVRLDSPDDSLSCTEIRSIGEACRQKLGDGFVTYGQACVAGILIHQLRTLKKTIAVAESCTGGLLGSRFTDVAGASKVFKGGIVCYRNEIKEQLLQVPDAILEQHGAVSAECAVAMATGVAELMESDYALSITGYAGPEAGREPAGTVYIGYVSPVGVWSRKAVLPGNRLQVKERAVNAALDFIRRKLRRYDEDEVFESLKC